MKVTGVIQSGKLVSEKVGYTCIKCTKPVELEFTQIMSEKTIQCFNNMAHASLCLDCYCDGKVPEVAECLLN